MTRRCVILGVDAELIGLVKFVECLARDPCDWERTPECHLFDSLDIHGLWVMLSGQLLRRYLELEDSGVLSPLGGIVSLCLILFIGMVARARVIAYGGGTSLIPRLYRCLFNHGGSTMQTLRQTNLDVWVGVLVALSPFIIPEYERLMMDVYFGAITRQNPHFETSTDLT
jgi:hypothetical protein